ncbi:class II aldolase/adducin family protein [Candidatus Hydrogenedentota bacterium]
MATERELRKDICEIGRLMAEKDLVVATDGNISVKLGPNRFLATPSGLAKGRLTPDDLIVVDAQGSKVSGRRKPTSEIKMHMIAYEQRPDVGAAIHAHPPTATAFTIAGVTLAQCVIPEVVFTLGVIPTSDYATPGTGETAEVVRDLVSKCDAMLLDRHGTLTIGPDIWDAYKKLEKVEHCAQVTMMARLLGNVKTLDPKQVGELKKVREMFNLPGKAIGCSECGACGREFSAESEPEETGPAQDELVARITAEVIKQLNTVSR